ncbi:hypothetical protein BB561_006999 [Smittium simulii]|uniref:Carbohydrate-binding module family 19 domain-containing protein n=1 Tax=Smittium simulii TaxID=133385 RepID=A0A2T9XY28_9FUNG|nr:hypothetical protein BB561_006999 [Smittium simulii]
MLKSIYKLATISLLIAAMSNRVSADGFRGDDGRCNNGQLNCFQNRAESKIYQECVDYKYMLRECGPGTVCKPLGLNHIYCGYPTVQK